MRCNAEKVGTELSDVVRKETQFLWKAANSMDRVLEQTENPLVKKHNF
jgi:hypothetical protein